MPGVPGAGAAERRGRGGARQRFPAGADGDRDRALDRRFPDVGDIAIDVEALLAERRAGVAADRRDRRRVVEADAGGIAARDRDRRRLRGAGDAGQDRDADRGRKR